MRRELAEVRSEQTARYDALEAKLATTAASSEEQLRGLQIASGRIVEALQVIEVKVSGSTITASGSTITHPAARRARRFSVGGYMAGDVF